VDVTDSTLSGNVANYGGGVYQDGQELDLTNSTVSGNTATLRSDGAGGGIYNYGIANLTDSTLSGNSSTEVGGGIFSSGTLDVANSTVANNEGGENGGGIAFGGTNADVTNSTLWGNSATSGGDIATDAPLTLSATIVANSPSGGDCSGTLTDGGYNLADDDTCGFSDTSLSDTPSGLDPSGLQYNGGPTETIALESGSAAIGTVASSPLCSTPDQREVPRPTPCDIGAVQLVIPQAITSPDSATATAGSSFSFTVTTSGLPVPVITEKGKLPHHVAFANNANGTATFSGTPTNKGVHHLTIKATFGAGMTKYVVTQAFTLTINAT
jgi:hypothetical protein